MRTKIAVLAVAVIAVSATLGASAYTTGNVSRTANIDVVTDDAGLIALADGTSGDLVTQSGDQLAIDFTAGGAGGVNTDAHYELGNPSDPTNQTAFNISNLDAEAHSFTVEYTNVNTNATGDGTENIQYRVYDSSGTEQAIVSEESTSNSATINVASGETLYVVMVIDTTGLDSSADLSGTFNVSA